MKEKKSFSFSLWHQSKELKKKKKITFNWKWERKCFFYLFFFHPDSFPSLDKMLASQSVAKGKEEEESHHLTMWYLSYVCQLWLEICCWRNFLFAFLAMMLLDPLVGPVRVQIHVHVHVHVVWKIRIEAVLLSSFFFIYFVSHSTLAHTHIYLPLALSNKISLPQLWARKKKRIGNFPSKLLLLFFFVYS